MILILSSQGPTLADRFNATFGRTPWFIRYDTNSGEWQALENSAPSQAHGAGVAAAQFLIDQGAQVAVSGRFGPNAHQALTAGDIAMLTQSDDSLTVQEVIALWQAGKLENKH
jgi:predicted Fe-Mo cluster-binding NifX family protein